MSNRLTLPDIASREDPDGKIAAIVEVLAKSMPELNDAPAFPSNAEMGNRVTIRSSLPTVYWRKINQGVTRSKGATHQRQDAIGFMTALSEVDTAIKKVVGEGKFSSARWTEDKAFLEALAQKASLTLWYGNQATDAAAFTGLQPRLGTLATAITGSQVRAHHGSPSGDDYTSIYIVDWSEDYCHLMYPKNGQMGLEAKDQGEQRVTDAEGLPFMAAVTEYNWLLGLTIKDDRHIARLANIDVSQALADTTFANLIPTSLVKLMASMPQPNGANRVLYCSRNILAALELQLMQQANILFSWGEYLGQKTLHFKGFPVRASDQISEAESLLS